MLKIGEGREAVVDGTEDKINIPEHLRSKAKSTDEFLNEVFPGVTDIVANGVTRMLTADDLWAKWLMERVVICPTNEDCEELSQMMARTQLKCPQMKKNCIFG